MKAETRNQLNRLLSFERPQLLAIIDAASVGNKWHCGASGNGGVARMLKVRTRDLEALVSACWNALAHQSCAEDPDGPRLYRRITGNLLEEMTTRDMITVMDWAETVEWTDEWTDQDDEKLWG